MKIRKMGSIESRKLMQSLIDSVIDWWVMIDFDLLRVVVWERITSSKITSSKVKKFIENYLWHHFVENHLVESQKVYRKLPLASLCRKSPFKWSQHQICQKPWRWLKVNYIVVKDIYGVFSLFNSTFDEVINNNNNLYSIP